MDLEFIWRYRIMGFLMRLYRKVNVTKSETIYLTYFNSKVMEPFCLNVFRFYR